MKNIEESVEALLEETINNLGYELYDVEYVKEGKDYYLRIYIDKNSGISLNDCEKVSNAINDILDKEDLIKEQYFLEVSSPGIEKVLKKDKHLEKNIGEKIQIKLFKKYEGKKELVGLLNKFDNEYVYIETSDGISKIFKKDISQIKTIYNW